MSKPDKKFSKQKKSTLKEWVVDEITKAIVDGRLQPNERINEARTAEEMGLSKSPVREAINELVNDGILASEPFKGTVVKGLSRKEVRELYSMRAVLESFAVELAMPRFTEKDAVILEKIVSHMERAADAGQRELVITNDLKFHRYLVEIAGHGILLEVWEKISGRLKMIILQKSSMFADMRDLASLHRLMIELFKQGKLEKLQESLKEHIYLNSVLMEEFFQEEK